MTKQSTSDVPKRSAEQEEAVSRFLAENPDYFLRHPQLLATLALPHPDTGRAISLVERQVRVLRERNDRLAGELHDLLAIARDNDQLSERTHRFTLAMIEAGGLDEVLDTAHDMLRQEFGIDAVALRLAGNPRPACPRREFVAGDDAVLDALHARLNERNRQPLCGASLGPDALAALFGEQAADIHSTAVVDMSRHALRGVLVLGSRDPQRFRADMGTVYLARLGELLMAAIVRHLVQADG
jgi:hypothetical protein